MRNLLLLLCFHALCQSKFFKDINNDGILNVWCFGDSITEGLGSEDNGYPEKVGDLLKVPVKNLGISGELAEETLKRLPSISTSPADIVVLMTGTNNVWTNLSPEKYENMIQNGVNIIFFYMKQPILMTYPPQSHYNEYQSQLISSYNNIIRKVSQINKIPLVDNEVIFMAYCENLFRCGLVTDDGLHLTSKGYQLIAESLAAVLLGLDPLSPSIRHDLSKALQKSEDSLIIGIKHD